MAVSISFTSNYPPPIRAVLLLVLLQVFLLESQAESIDAHARRFLRSSSSSSSSSSITILFGTVYCDSCLETRLTPNSIVFAEAEIQIECTGSISGIRDHSEVVTTNETGQFQAQVPSHFDIATVCSARLLSKPLDSCSIAATSSYSSAARDLVFRPRQPLGFCSSDAPRREALTLEPPDPPEPGKRKKVSTQAYKLAPPDPPRPRKIVVTKSYHLGPPNPPQPRGDHN